MDHQDISTAQQDDSVVSQSDMHSFTARVYSIGETTRIVGRNGFPKSRAAIRSWLRILRPQGTHVDGTGCVSFHELISLEALRLLSQHAMPLRDSRAMHARVRDLLEVDDYPFARRRFLVNDGDVHVKARLPTGHADGSDMDQAPWGPIKPILEFSQDLHYWDDLPSRWMIAPGVQIDPLRQWGDPCIIGTRINTEVVYGMVTAGDFPEDVASDYRISIEAVRNAVAFEQKLRRHETS